MSKGTQTYHEVTGRPISVAVQEWISRLESKFGEERVVAGILAEGHRLDFNKIIGRVDNRLHEENQRSPRPPMMVELSGAALMAVVRGEKPEPPRPYIRRDDSLTTDECGELLTWLAR